MTLDQCSHLLQRFQAGRRWIVSSLQLLRQRWTGSFRELQLLVDADYYRGRYPDVARLRWPPFAHYLNKGAAEGRNPHPLFDTSFYLAENPDVAAAGVNPLVHWLQYGAREGRDPHPLFDTSYYLAENPDVAATAVNPLVHWLHRGARERRDPHPLFDTSFYVDSVPGLAGSDENPLLHWISQGARERRNPHPLFDCQYYASQEPPLDASIEDLLTHYLLSGGRDRRSPHPDFDPAFYLAHNPDVQDGGWNPLAHFVSHGLKEGRSPKAPPDLTGLDAAWHQLADIDSELRSTPLDIGHLPVRRAPRHRDALAFRVFMDRVTAEIDVLFLFPSSRAVLSFAPALRRLLGALRAKRTRAAAVLLVMEHYDSDMVIPAEGDMMVLGVDDLDRSLTVDGRTRLVTHIVLNCQPRLVCDCGSTAGERALTRHSRALASISRLGVLVSQTESTEALERRLAILGSRVSVLLLEDQGILRRNTLLKTGSEKVDLFVLSDQAEPLKSRNTGVPLQALMTPGEETE